MAGWGAVPRSQGEMAPDVVSDPGPAPSLFPGLSESPNPSRNHPVARLLREGLSVRPCWT
jgi:hypothetical protein